MHLFEAIKKLKKSKSQTYVYASDFKDGWLLRMHLTSDGIPVIAYSSPIHTCEEKEPLFVVIHDPEGEILGCDWKLNIPKEWIKPDDLVWPEKENDDCYHCAHCVDRGSTWCTKHKAYVSNMMTCKRWAKAPWDYPHLPKYDEHVHGLH